MGTKHAGDFMRWFCSDLGTNNQAVKTVQEAVKKSECRRSTISVVAALIYIIAHLSDDKKHGSKLVLDLHISSLMRSNKPALVSSHMNSHLSIRNHDTERLTGNDRIEGIAH